MNYKFDKNQVILIALIGVNIFTFLILPYRETLEGYIPERGYALILSWICIAFLTRMSLHAFGFDLYNFAGSIIGFALFYSGMFVLNYIFFTSESHNMLYSYLVLTLISSGLTVGMCYIDRSLYDLQTRLKKEDTKR